VSQEKVLIGKVGSPVGIKGEFRVNLYSQDSGNLKEGKVLLLERAEKSVSGAIEKVRYQKDKPVVRLTGIEDRNAAEDIRGMDVSIYANDMEELPEGEHYVRDLIGCKVVDLAQDGAEIGVLRDVIQNTAQSVLDVSTPDGKQVLIPAVDAFMRSIDEDAGVIEVELIPGFLG
ncbi:MAG: 16S rRNA processing protein RimM, partial [Mogibacterium sp.]|nr:16S rRNA processing protein RimM [Mogibacterium sp.]